MEAAACSVFTVWHRDLSSTCIFPFPAGGCKFMILLLWELRPRRRRRNSEAQSRLSEVVSDDSRQHVLDYVPLFSWCDSNATWQCQQQCFLQQKEWWLAIHLWLGIFTWHWALCNKPGQVIFVWGKKKKKPSVRLQVHKNALYVWGGN